MQWVNKAHHVLGKITSKDVGANPAPKVSFEYWTPFETHQTTDSEKKVRVLSLGIEGCCGYLWVVRTQTNIATGKLLGFCS